MWQNFQIIFDMELFFLSQTSAAGASTREWSETAQHWRNINVGNTYENTNDSASILAKGNHILSNSS